MFTHRHTHTHTPSYTHTIHAIKKKLDKIYRVHPILLTRSEVAQESPGWLSIIATASFLEDKKMKEHLKATFGNLKISN